MAKIGTFILKSSLIRNFLISYTLVFLIPITIIFTFFYRSSLQSVREEIQESHLSLTRSYADRIDSRIRDLQIILGFLNGDEIANSLLAKDEGDLTPGDRWNISILSNKLNDYLASNGTLDYLYLYFSHTGRIITPTNSPVGGKELLSMDYEPLKGNTYDSWLSIIDREHRGNFIHMNGTGAADSFSDLVYISSLPVFPVSSGDKMRVVMHLNEAFIGGEIGDLPGKLVIRDSDGNVIYANRNPQAVHEDALEEHIITTVTLTRWKGTVDYILPEELYLENLNRIRLTSFIVLFFCFILGGVLSYYFTMRNYNPMKKLLELSRDLNQKERDNTDWDELDRIHEALLNGLDEKSAHQKWLNRESIEEKNRTHIHLLFLDEPFRSVDAVGALENEFKINSHFCLVVTEIPGLERDRDIVTELLGEMFVGDLPSLVLWRNNFFYNLTSCSPGEESRLKEGAGRVQLFLEDSFGLESFSAISSIRKGIGEVRACYKEAVQTLDFLKLTGRTNIMTHGDLMRTNLPVGEEVQNLEQEEKAFARALTYSHFDEAKSVLNRIFDRGLLNETFRPQMLRFRLFSFINRILNILMSLDIPDKDLFLEELKPYARLQNCQNAREWQAELNILLDDIAEYYGTHKSDELKNFQQKISSFVEENYTDPLLNVSLIASVFDYNMEYLSRKFKQALGKGLLDYIHRVRVDRAKSCLREKKDLPLQEITRDVGYSSVDTFIRAFKRLEGVTPGEFRRKKDSGFS